MQRVLLGTFVKEDKLYITEAIQKIKDNFTIVNDTVFVLKGTGDLDQQLILTYNIQKFKDMPKYRSLLPCTIQLHRKKATNTLFTLNALNILEGQGDDGNIDWEKYKNCVITTHGIGQLNIFKTRIDTIINTQHSTL